MLRKKAAKTNTTPNTTLPANKLLFTLKTAASLLALSSSIFVTETTLTPLFGGVATDLYLQNVAGTLIVTLTILPLASILGAWQETVLGSLLCVAPFTLHWLASLTTLLGNPILGPILAYTPVLMPIVFSATDGIRGIFKGGSHSLKALSGIAISMFAIQTQSLWAYIPYNRFFSQPILLLVFGLVLIGLGEIPTKSIASGRRRFQNRNYKAFILPLLLTLIALSLPPSRIRSLPYTHTNGLLRILSSTPSVTGRIVVGEDYTHGFRFLRADHSLLGGVWINKNFLVKMDDDGMFVRDKNGTKLGESIYTTFVLQEAARLQEIERPHQNTLIIGLGVGIAAQAFIQHGLSTSIVEIDPAVFSAARDYFGVPEPSVAYIEDARSWVERQAGLRNGTYDIIVHDCFSGGGVPAHLFTSEFWHDLRTFLSPDGIVAVNYAGVIGSPSSKAVLLTLKQSFGQCRVFHDYKTDVTEEKLTSEFLNLVFFCSPSPKPLTFRGATRGDYLSSYLREHVLSVLPDREVRPELILGDTPPEQQDEYLLTDKHNPLGAWQDKAALDHWRVMRSVLPDYVWNTY